MCVTATATTVALTSARASGEFSPEARLLLLLLLLLLGAWATLSSCSVTERVTGSRSRPSSLATQPPVESTVRAFVEFAP
jgi:hypothetical protein